MSKYNRKVERVFKNTPAPYSGIIVDLIEYPDYLALRVYKNNIEDFSESQKISIAEYLYVLRDTIRDLGVKCHLEGVE